jgi:putative membrane protein
MEAKFTDSQRICTRGFMSIARTVMANKSTFLAYCQTAFALVIAGLTFLEFTKALVLAIVAILFIPARIVVFFFGL